MKKKLLAALLALGVLASLTACGGKQKTQQDAAADGRRDAQQPHAEDVHVLFDAEHRAADGERDRPGQFKQKEKGFHRHDLRKKSTPLPWCRCVLCPFT